MNRPRARRAATARVWLVLTAICLVVQGCSSQQLYHTGQAWRRSLCAKYTGDDRMRCEAEVDRPARPDE